MMMTTLTLMATSMAAALSVAAGPQGMDKGPVTLEDRKAQATAQFERMDKDGDGYLTETDRPDPGDRFAMMDEDGSGAIEKEEMVSRALDRFDERDANGNGTIDEDERVERKRRMARRMEKKAPATREDVETMVATQFDRLDTDGNGALTEEELAAARESRKAKWAERRGGERKRPDLSTIDADGDGRVSLEEHLDHVEVMFRAMDKDGDGTLTQEERRAAWKAKRGD